LCASFETNFSPMKCGDWELKKKNTINIIWQLRYLKSQNLTIALYHICWCSPDGPLSITNFVKMHVYLIINQSIMFLIFKFDKSLTCNVSLNGEFFFSWRAIFITYFHIVWICQRTNTCHTSVRVFNRLYFTIKSSAHSHIADRSVFSIKGVSGYNKT
jgi:hypothetical protein